MTNNKPRKRVLRSIPMHGIIYLVVGLVGCCSVKCYLLQTTSSLICLHFFGRRSVGHGKINQNHGNQFSEWKCYEGCEFCCCFFFLIFRRSVQLGIVATEHQRLACMPFDTNFRWIAGRVSIFCFVYLFFFCILYFVCSLLCLFSLFFIRWLLSLSRSSEICFIFGFGLTEKRVKRGIACDAYYCAQCEEWGKNAWDSAWPHTLTNHTHTHTLQWTHDLKWRK